jgi:hypothetical protein
MKLLSSALVLGLICSTAALADGDAMKSNTNAMSGSAMSSSNSMSGQNAMAPAKPAKKPAKKKPATNGMMGQPDSMSGQSTNAMSGSGDNMAAPAKPH